MATNKRFGSLTENEIAEKRTKTDSTSTLHSNQVSAKAFRSYLKEKKQDVEFEKFESNRLAEMLGYFYLEARTTNGEHYKASSLENLRHGLNRYLRSPPINKTFDIIKGTEFTDANQSYKAAIAELKRLGKGDTAHYPVIGDEDLCKLYSSIHLKPDTPTGLANKIQFDVRLYFMRRGMENMDTMTKETFEVKNHPNGSKYVQKKLDELTKNHRGSNRTAVSGVMPELDGNPMCPVASFQKYLEKLNPSCNRLWQRAKDTFLETDETWYCNSPIGTKTLGKFMKTLSVRCNLSEVFTNHSIRATGATILSRHHFGPAQIMGVSGHRSVSSLTVYQRVNTAEKVEMGKALAGTLTPTENNQLAITAPGPSRRPPPSLPAPSSTTVTSADASSSTSNNDLPDDLLPLADEVLLDLLKDMPVPPAVMPAPLSMIGNQINQHLSAVSSISPGNMPLLIGCSIGTINIVNKS